MRRWLLWIHLYGGLACSAYLIIFGLSSLEFNHHFAFAQPPVSPDTVHWERSVASVPAGNKDKAAEALRDQLGLMWGPLPWETRRDPDGSLSFSMDRPGKHYRVDAHAADGRVKVEEQRTGFWSVVMSLHAPTGLPNSRLIPWWGVYTEFCTAVVIFSAASGIYLWWKARRDRRAGLLTAAAGLVASLGFIAFVVLHG